MKKIVVLLLALLPGLLMAQNVPAHITLKEGKAIDVHDFSQLDCSGKRYFDNHILIKGMYNDIVTELKEYGDISRIELKGFTEPAKMTGDNEKGTIIITKKNGVSVTLENATISLSCYGTHEKINELQLQMINPLTEQLVEIKIDTKDIMTIEFN